MRSRRIVQAIGSRIEPVSLSSLSHSAWRSSWPMQNRRLSPELRLDTFENQAAALWSIDQPLPDMPSPRLVAHASASTPASALMQS